MRAERHAIFDRLSAFVAGMFHQGQQKDNLKVSHGNYRSIGLGGQLEKLAPNDVGMARLQRLPKNLYTPVLL
ncbi:MAG TPA: hypothetical protein VI386_19735 [Candidatus Sulfotelmatobacter sp.]